MPNIKEALVERREQVWKMRVVDRMTYRQIAKALNTTTYTVFQDAKWLADNRVKALAGKDKELIATQNEIYEALLNEWVPIALGDGEVQDRLFATDRVARLLTDQAKLFGFSTLPKATGEAKELGKGLAEGVIEAMAKLADKSRGKVIEAEIIEEPKTIRDAE